MVADMHGRRSRDIVDKAITALLNLEHRGAQGAEPHTGDGAGILLDGNGLNPSLQNPYMVAHPPAALPRLRRA